MPDRGTRPSGSNQRAALALIALVLLVGTPIAEGKSSRPHTEFEVKAAYLSHFTNFVEWPARAVPDDVFEVCIVGDDPFGKAFEPFLDQEVQGRRLRIVRHPNAVDIPRCQILFVSASQKDHVGQILQQVADKPVLTVSDIEDFAARGGILNFVLRDRKVRFSINLEAADRAGVKMSSRLLKLADIVKTKAGD